MLRIKYRAVGLIVAVGLIGGAVPASEVVASSTPSVVVAKACVYGKINGERKRLCRGQFCQRGAKSQYPKHGFSCTKRDRNGRYHLR